MQTPLLLAAGLLAGLLISPASRAAEWTPVPGPLMTRWAADVSPANALPEYPRPQMVRPKWQTLNGLWDYAVADKSAAMPMPFDGKLLVPFPVESPLSGVRKALAPNQRLWYRRTFEVPADWRGGFSDRVLLHFGAVEFEAAVSVNGSPVGSHRGGYDAFALDITDALRPEGEQEVIVSVLDPTAAAENRAEFGRLIGQRFNHPSIIAWVMFNEGWGQFDTLRIAAWAKGLDPTRLIDEASGFPHHGGDVIDVHGGIPPTAPNQLGLDTESMGIGLFVPGHMWPGELWGVVSYDLKTGEATPGREPMNDAAKAWYTRQVRTFFKALHDNAPRTGHGGDFKVQLTDVEIESNGLLTYERAVWKVDPAAIAPAAHGEPLPLAVAELAGPGDWAYTTDQPPADWAAPDIRLRREFDLSSVPKRPVLRIRHDETVHVSLNGVPAASDGGRIDAADDFALSPASRKALKVGRNVIAVRCHQVVGGQLVDVRLLELIE